jgi:hypothetical protein
MTKKTDLTKSEKRRISKDNYKNLAEKLSKNGEIYKNHLLTYDEIFNMIGIPKRKQYQAYYVQRINDAFDELKLKCRLYVKYNIGAELKFDGNEIPILVLQRYKKELNAVRRSIKLCERRSDAYEGRLHKILRAECKAKEALLESMLSYFEMDSLMDSVDRKELS